MQNLLGLVQEVHTSSARTCTHTAVEELRHASHVCCAALSGHLGRAAVSNSFDSSGLPSCAAFCASAHRNRRLPTADLAPACGRRPIREHSSEWHGRVSVAAGVANKGLVVLATPTALPLATP